MHDDDSISDKQIYTTPGDYEWPDEYLARMRKEREKAWKEENSEIDKAHKKKWKDDNRDIVNTGKIKARTNNYLSKLFIAIDSEGQDVLCNAIRWKDTPYEDHKIFMWGAASIDDKRTPEWLVHLETTDSDKRELDPLAVLEWLVGLPEKFREAVFVMYSFSYDVIHILKHFRFEKAWEIFKGEKYNQDRNKRRKLRYSATFCGGRFDQFAIKLKNRKQLDIWKLRDHARPYLRAENGEYELDKNGRKQIDAVAHITIYDAYPFFQQSFAKAAKVLVKLGSAKQEDLDFVEEMKAKRGRFASEPIGTIQRYTEFELRYLAQLMTVLRETLHGIKLESAPDMKPIHIKDWYGPGPVARALLTNLDIIKKHYGGFIHSERPGPLQLAAHHSMAGGRIELLKVGYAPDAVLHSYDIASAYPHAISQLPSLANGEWKKLESGLTYESLTELKHLIQAASPVSMFRIGYRFPRFEKYSSDRYKTVHIPFYPLFFRSSSGAIYFPWHGHGWYMRDETLAAIAWLERFVPIDKWRSGRPNTKQWETKDVHFQIKEAWIFIPSNIEEKPFAAVMNELYDQRVRFKRSVPYDVREKFYKLPLNSIYGKMAQSIGGTQTKYGWKPPPTANPYYCASITANCRLRLIEAALLDPHSVVAFMTDGIVSERRLEGLLNVVSEGEESKLGDWEHALVEGATFLHAGVYSMRKVENGKAAELTKTRGFDPKRVTQGAGVGDILIQKSVEAMSQEYNAEIPSAIFLPIRNLVTIGMALSAAENNRDLWKRGLAGRWSPDPDSPDAINRAINCDKLGGKRQWIKGREADWQTTRQRDGTLRLSNRVGALVPTIPADNPEAYGTISAIYKPEWIDPDFGEEMESGEEQEDIADGM